LHGSPPFANLFFVLKGTAPGDFIKLSLKKSKSWTFYMIISSCHFDIFIIACQEKKGDGSCHFDIFIIACQKPFFYFFDR